MQPRVFIDIFVRGNVRGKYDFLNDNKPAEAQQLAKTGADATDYFPIYVKLQDIRDCKISNELLFKLKAWNGLHGKAKLKIRLNAHGADATDGLWMGSQRASASQIAAWLRTHGLKHKSTDAWTLVISLVVCFASKVTAPKLVKALNDGGIHGFKVTASPEVTEMPNGQPGWSETRTTYLLGFIPWGTEEVSHAHWSTADGSKVELLG